jgi:glycosyltransferase involved in cell wall biosynthesis
MMTDRIMKSTTKVSVIVPVYKTEQYLEKCLQSLLKQTLDEMEIIVVNDGSPDNAQNIIDDYVMRYPDTIRALQQENQGLGAARNLGLDHIRGEYVGFVDSDDWVRLDMFQQMYERAVTGDCDIVISDMTCVSENGTASWTAKGYRGFKPKPETVSDFMLSCADPAFAWNKLYRRSLFDIVRFPSIWFEDIGTIPIIMSHTRHISYINEPVYYYLQRKDAITSQNIDKRNLDVIQAWERCIIYSNIKYQWETAYAIYNNIIKFIEYRKEYSNEYANFLSKYKYLFKENELVCLNIQLQEMITANKESENRLHHIEERLCHSITENIELVNKLDAISTSTSWRLTKPLRLIMDKLRGY